MPRPSASPALRVLRTLRTGSRMTLRRHKDFLALAGALQKIAGYRGLLAVRASPFPWLAAKVFKQLIVQGAGYGLIPVLDVKQELKHKQVVILGSQRRYAMPMYWHSWQLTSRVYQRFNDTVIKIAKQHLQGSL